MTVARVAASSTVASAAVAAAESVVAVPAVVVIVAVEFAVVERADVGPRRWRLARTWSSTAPTLRH